MRRILSATTCVLALAGGAVAARAQEAPAADHAAPPVEVADTGIGDIIVTAQKRSESVQKSSLAIEVINAERIQRVGQASDLSTIQPGLQIANSGNITQAYIRGVGSFVATGRQENAVAFSSDGVYLQTGTMVSPAMFDIERVEVLKGPQGTLYGRNATAGAINLISASPRLGEVSGYVGAEAGNYNLFRTEAALNVPLGDTVAVRAAVRKADRDGYFTDGTGDENMLQGRVKVLWQPRDGLKLTLSVEGGKTDAVGAGTAVVPFLSNPWIGLLDPRRLSLVTAPRPLESPYFINNEQAVSGTLEWEVGPGTLTVQPAYRHEHYDQRTYGPGYYFQENTETRQKSLEVRYGGNGPALKWVVGGYVLAVDQTLDYRVANASLLQNINIVIPHQSTNTYALFGEATYSLTSALRLIAGLRYSNERTSGSGTNNAVDYRGATPAFSPSTESGDYNFASRVSADAITFRTGVEYDVAPASMLFATFSRGFKGGGWFPDRPGANTTYKPEKLDAVELGLRSRFLDNRLQLNLEGFYWKYTDQQQAYVGVTSTGFPALITTNAGGSTIYGGNVDLVWRVTSADTIRGSVEYLHSKYDTFRRNTPGPALPGSLCTSSPAASGFTVDCSGVVLQRAPRWTGSAGYQHEFNLGGGGTVTAGGDMTFGSARYLSLDFIPSTRDGGYAVFNADLTYRTADRRWSVAAYVLNIGEQAFATGGSLNVGTFNATINPPRTYGVRVRHEF